MRFNTIPNLVAPQHGITHAGKFHADDVFSTAFLEILNPDYDYQRVLEVPADIPEKTVVYDIGRGEFDHHQTDAEIRDNGVQYASFGLLWRKYSPLVLGEKQAARVDTDIVQPIDKTDNGGTLNPLSVMIGNFNPQWNEDGSPGALNVAFAKAVDVAKQLLVAAIESAQAKEDAAAVAEAAIAQEGPFAVLEQYAPIVDDLAGTDKLFLIFPSNRGGWNARAIPKAAGTREYNVLFPEEWRGEPAYLLPNGLNFVHKNGFIASATTRDNAIAACRIAIQMATNDFSL